MRIKKIKASQDMNQQPIMAQDPCNKYSESISLIKAAIESLSLVAADDEVAKDSIANLSVVLLDLKGNC